MMTEAARRELDLEDEDTEEGLGHKVRTTL